MTSATQRAPRGWLLLCVALLVVVGAYLPGLGGPFLWDDRHLLRDSSAALTIEWLKTFTQPFWFGSPEAQGSLSYFRPLTTLSFNVDMALHGDASAGFHLTNIAAHLLATGLLFALLRRRRVPELLAFALVLVWALLPRLTESAAWISGRCDVLAGAFALGALLAHQPRSRTRLALAAVLALAAMWCKESGLGAFAALGILELFGPDKVTEQTERRKRLLLLAGPLLLYLVSRIAAGAISLGDGLAVGPTTRAVTVLEALGRYAYMLANPFQPRSLMGVLGKPSWAFVALGGALALGLAVVVARRPKPSTNTLAYLAFGSVPLLLVMHLTPLPVTVVTADRYLYLPSAGLLLAAAPAVQAVLAARRALWAPVAVFIVALGVRTVERVSDYADEPRFWLTALAQSPEDSTPPIELGGTAYRAGCFTEALQLYTLGAQLDRVPVSEQLGTVSLVANLLGKRDLAFQASDDLLRAYPRRADMRLRQATLAVSALDWSKARARAQQALELEPGYQPAHSFLDELPELERLHAAVVVGALSSVQLTLEMRTMRYPEALATLRSMLDDPRADAVVLRQGIEFVVTRGDPADAAPLLARYLREHADADAPRLVAAAQVRFDAATNVRAQLRESASR